MTIFQAPSVNHLPSLPFLVVFFLFVIDLLLVFLADLLPLDFLRRGLLPLVLLRLALLFLDALDLIRLDDRFLLLFRFLPFEVVFRFGGILLGMK